MNCGGFKVSAETSRTVQEFVRYVINLNYKQTCAAIELLRSMMCVDCGTELNEKNPKCYCECDE